MRNILKTAFVLTAAMSGALVACSAGSQESAGSDEEASRIRHSSRVHPMAVQRNDPKGSAEVFPPEDSFAPNAADAPGPTGAQLAYFGGPVLSSVKIYTVYWGASVPNQAALNTAYGKMVDSEYLDWLSEYNTPTQTIGRGSFGGSFVDNAPPVGSSVTDAQIQSELAKLIHAHSLPANDANNLYMVHFPPGMIITGPAGNGTSCVQFCAYHGTFVLDGKDAFYGILPDQGGACAGGCGTGSQFDNTTMVASHEVIEAVTDSAVGLATTSGPPLAWYDNANGEIGDICAGPSVPPAVVNGVTIQLEWSNQSNLCIATRASIGGDAGIVDSGGDAGDAGDGGSDGGTGCAGDSEAEPNDTRTEANALNASMCGAITSSADLDYFTFSTDATPITYDLVLAASGNATVKMWKKVGTKYRKVTNTSATEISHATHTAGTYVVLVSSPSGTAQTYTLSLQR